MVATPGSSCPRYELGEAPRWESLGLKVMGDDSLTVSWKDKGSRPVKYFYYDKAKDIGIAGDDAEEVDLDRALQVWDSLTRTGGSYFGIVCPNDLTLQLIWEDDQCVWVEIPFPKIGGSLYKPSTYEECTQAIEDTFAGKDPERIEGLQFEDWPGKQAKDITLESEEPVEFATEEFGELWLNGDLARFESETQWNQEEVEISFDAETLEQLQELLPTARTLWSDQTGWNQKIEDYAVGKLLDLKNDVWLQEDETKVTAEQFKSRMILESINIESGGHFTFWYDDDDMFWCHMIEIRGSLKEGLTSAGLAG